MPEIGLPSPVARFELTPLAGGPPARVVERSVLEPLRREVPGASFELDPAREEARAYYSELCFRLVVTTPRGGERALVDGGFTRWTSALLGDRKERLLTSGIGSELACSLLAPTG